jgi:DNA-binding winged helix-turn-helix (wHTH) protein/TolB-like protein
VLLPLQSQPAQVLLYLVERAGQIVSRHELQNAVWGGETFVDFDRGLNYCVAQIRSAVGDDSAEPTYIRTLPKRGYQFIGAVERLASQPAQKPQKPKTQIVRFPSGSRAVMPALTGGLAIVLAFAAGYWLRSQNAKGPPIVAVARFDNETGNPALTLLSDGLTDGLVAQLTYLSDGRYRVIGNAYILRQSRDQRDLSAIASSLHASFVVLGQVQNIGQQTRILAHLIRLPDQTHIWVVRMDLSDPLAAESETAQKIANQFSQRMSASPPPANR